jgi:hypothetical protein
VNCSHLPRLFSLWVEGAQSFSAVLLATQGIYTTDDAAVQPAASTKAPSSWSKLSKSSQPAARKSSQPAAPEPTKRPLRPKASLLTKAPLGKSAPVKGSPKKHAPVASSSRHATTSASASASGNDGGSAADGDDELQRVLAMSLAEVKPASGGGGRNGAATTSAASREELFRDLAVFTGGAQDHLSYLDQRESELDTVEAAAHTVSARREMEQVRGMGRRWIPSPCRTILIRWTACLMCSVEPRTGDVHAGRGPRRRQQHRHDRRRVRPCALHCEGVAPEELRLS